MASDLEFRVLGGIELERRGQAVPIGGPKPRLALALLAARRGSVVSTDRLCDELWGNNPPADPLGVLQSHLSRLRRALRPEAEIIARPPGYVLQVPDEMIDAGRFEQLCRRASSSSNPKSDESNCWKAHSRVGGGRRSRSSPSMNGHGSRRCVSTNFMSLRKRSFRGTPCSRRTRSAHRRTRRLLSHGIPCGSVSGTSSSSPSIAVAAQPRRSGERRRSGSCCERNSGSILRRRCASWKLVSSTMTRRCFSRPWRHDDQ